MKFLKGLWFFFACGFFAIIGNYIAKDFEIVGMLTGFSFGLMFCNFLDMLTRSHQAYLVEKLQNGYRPPES